MAKSRRGTGVLQDYQAVISYTCMIPISQHLRKTEFRNLIENNGVNKLNSERKKLQ